MPSQLSKGTTYVSGGTVDYNDLNNLVDGGTILKGAITEQATKSVPIGADQILIADSASSDALKRATITSVFASAPNIGSTTAGTGAFTTLISTGATSLANTSGNVNVGFAKGLAQSKLHIVHNSSTENGLTITDITGTPSTTISTLTGIGNVATATTGTAHGLSVGNTVVISGATQDEYNGVFVVGTTATTTEFTYGLTISPTASPATGTKYWRKTTGANYQIGSNSSNSGKLLFKDLNTLTTTLAIDASGNVGINNTSPSTKLDVTGDVKISTNATVGTTASSISVSSITFSTTTATATSNAHGYSNGDFIRISGASETVYNGSFAISNVATNTFQYTLPSTPSANASGTLLAYKDNFKKVIGNSFTSGRFGIGNVTPTVELDVTGSIKASGTITSTGAITSSGTVTAPSITLGSSPIYGVRAWASFNGTLNTGTFAGGASTATRASGVNSVTVTCTNDHGLIVGNYIYALTGVVPQLRMVSSVGSSKTFQFTSGETTALSAVSITFALCPIYASGGIGSITKEASGKYYVNFSPALADEKYAVQVSPPIYTNPTYVSRLAIPTSTSYGFGFRQDGGGTYSDSDYTTVSFIR
jgi:hypothetical protein